jgi:hypothetical protein
VVAGTSRGRWSPRMGRFLDDPQRDGGAVLCDICLVLPWQSQGCGLLQVIVSNKYDSNGRYGNSVKIDFS